MGRASDADMRCKSPGCGRYLHADGTCPNRCEQFRGLTKRLQREDIEAAERRRQAAQRHAKVSTAIAELRKVVPGANSARCSERSRIGWRTRRASR